MRRALALGAAVLLAVGGAACSDDDDGAAPTPRPDGSPVTTVVDYSGAVLEGVAGQTTTTIRTTGTASVVGSVTDPAGPLPGATVRIERIVGDQEVRTDVVSGPDGRFELRNVPGGRYRVRAFLPPTLAMVTPDVRFLRDGQEHAFDLRVEDQRGVVARASVAPDPPTLGAAVNLVAVVASRSVDVDGIVRSTPVSGLRVELDGLGRWRLRSDEGSGRPLNPRQVTTSTTNPSGTRSGTAFTDGLGQVRFELRCLAAGSPGLTLLVPVTVQQPPLAPDLPPPPPTTRVDSLPLDVPACVDPSALPPDPEDGGDGDGDGEDASQP